MALGVKPTVEQQSEIDAMMEPFTSALVAGDWDALLQNYTEDTVVMPPNSPALVGREAIRAWAQTLPPVTEFVGRNDEVVCIGDIAIIRGSYEMSLAVPDLPEPVRDVGSYIEIRQRQPDGRWLLAQDIFNTDLPMPE